MTFFLPFHSALPLACMQCVWEKFGPTWLVFAVFRLVAVGIVAGPKLDVVRVLGIGVLLEWVLLFSFAESMAMVEGIAVLGQYAFVALGILWMLLLGVGHFVTLAGLSRTRYLHGGKPRVSLLKLVMLIPIFTGIHVLQFAVPAFAFGAE